MKADPKLAAKFMKELAEAKFDVAAVKPGAPVARKFKDIPEAQKRRSRG